MDQQPTADQMKKLNEIAQKYGVSVSKLLENKNPNQIINEFEAGSFRILND